MIKTNMDIGIDVLRDIKSDTSGIKKDTSTLPAINVGIDNLNTKFDSFTTHLERILEKLAER